MTGLLYPPHIAGKPHLLDAPISTLLEDQHKNRQDLRELLKAVENMHIRSIELISMVCKRGWEIKNLAEDNPAKPIIADALDEIVRKLRPASAEVFGLYLHVSRKASGVGAIS
ncbi:MAG: hypothetical protein L6R38_001740 [Xanthoria sp. 2 TBL-2021]|nr:MAG: hypothetical protein L6R38_001740 [Xanthoria sp. 2 TBL-2021]